VCTRCSTQSPVRKISFFWKPGGVPPHLGHESTICILCNDRFRQDMQIQVPQMDSVGTNNRGSTRARPRGGASTNTSTSTNGNNYRGTNNDRNNAGARTNNTNNIVCFRCNQPGHFANTCTAPRN
jgi:hypothetical protein